jgi:hypothetical protein
MVLQYNEIFILYIHHKNVLYMKSIVKRFNEYVNENVSTTETDIREYLREQWDIARNNIFIKMGGEFPIENNKIGDEDKLIIDGLINKLVEVYANIAIDNIPSFNKTWIHEDDKIVEGDTVEDVESGEVFFVSRFGSNNNFFDNNKNVFINLDRVKKIKN